MGEREGERGRGEKEGGRERGERKERGREEGERENRLVESGGVLSARPSILVHLMFTAFLPSR